MAKISIVAGKVLFAFVLALICYATYWRMRYSIPCGKPLLVDVRHDKSATPHYVIFCGSLADNPLGFPGHCYVAWADRPDPDLLHCESAAYEPKVYIDQIRSLWMHVPAILYRNAGVGNTRNLDEVIAEVDEVQWKKSKAERDAWEVNWFQVGYRDCAAFTNHIAQSIELKTPDTFFVYPQDYIRELKELNHSQSASQGFAAK